MDKEEKVKRIAEVFARLYPDARCTLEFDNAIQLLVSAQLAAQCTDERVNMIAKTLYKKYLDAKDFADADLSELEEDIKPAGFFRNKARNIKNCCRMIVEDFGGDVPDNMEDMLKLPGVGRKTANLVLGEVFGIPGIVVDTHVKRLSNRIGLSSGDNPVKIEFDLMKVVPKERWTKFCHQIVFHGRAVCTAIKPDCLKCGIKNYCNYGQR